MADTMPCVAVLVRPSGVPIARTMSPTSSRSESAKTAGRSPAASLTLMTARSSGAYLPTSLAVRAVAEFDSSTLNLVALPTTWAFVTMSPAESYTTPEPRPLLVLISTTEGRSRLMTPTYVCCSPLACPAGVIDADGRASVVELLAELHAASATATTNAPGNAANRDIRIHPAIPPATRPSLSQATSQPECNLARPKTPA